MPKAVGMLSGGAGSWGACRRWADEHGTDELTLLFTDVGGEDEDTIRFRDDAAADIGAPLVVVCDGRSIWDVFREKRWLGNSRLAHCSWELKTGPARAWVDENAPDTDVVIVGIDSTEIHRLEAITAAWQPYQVVAPLTDRPLLWKPLIIRQMRERGLVPPRMYELGFAHANCPACVKGGQKHWLRLLRTWPDRYAEAEKREQEHRAEFGDVTILAGMTLQEFRLQAESNGGQVDLFDEGGCGCFSSPQ